MHNKSYLNKADGVVMYVNEELKSKLVVDEVIILILNYKD